MKAHSNSKVLQVRRLQAMSIAPRSWRWKWHPTVLWNCRYWTLGQRHLLLSLWEYWTNTIIQAVADFHCEVGYKGCYNNQNRQNPEADWWQQRVVHPQHVAIVVALKRRGQHIICISVYLKYLLNMVELWLMDPNS